jgi:hypothetical protein
MHGYFNDIHIINADRIPNCLIELRSFSYSDRASLGLLHSGAMRYIVDRQQFPPSAQSAVSLLSSVSISVYLWFLSFPGGLRYLCYNTWPYHMGNHAACSFSTRNGG